MSLDHVAFFDPDVDGLVSFYSELFGTGPVERVDGFARFEVDPVDVIVHTTGEADADGPPMETHVGFAVADVDESFEALAGQGVTVVRKPGEYEWGRSAYLRATDGTLVQIVGADR